MGKGNRSRIERAMNDNANSGKNVQVKKNTVSGAGIFVAIAAILVVVALLIGCVSMVNNGGWIARSQNVISVEGANGETFTVNGAMMTYFFSTQFNNYYQYFNQMYSQFASSGLDVSSYVYQAMGIKDPSKSLKDQEYAGTTEDGEKITAFDYYMGLTEDYVTRLLTYCQFASKEGMALDEEDAADIDHTIEELKKSFENQKNTYAQFGASYPYKNFNEFLAGTYGNGVNEKDVRNCLKLITLASKFEEKLNEDAKQTITADKENTAVEKYVEENPSLFLMADYYAYAFSVSNKGKTDAEFEADKKEILEKAKKLAEVEGKDAYKAAVIDLLIAAEKESYRENNWEKYLKENDNDEDRANEALEKYFETAYNDAFKETKFNATFKEGYKYPSTHTDLSKWIFGFTSTCPDDCDHKKDEDHVESNDPAKKGDITYIETTETKEETVKKEEATTGATTEATTEEPTTDAAAPAAETTKEETTTAPSSSSATQKIKVTTYTVTVYLLEKEAYRNTEITKHFGYAMFDSKEEADKFYAEYKKGEMNKDTLLDVIEKMHEDLKIFAYDAVEDYMVGDLEDQNFKGADEWLRTAKPGDHTEVIELTYSTSETIDGKPKDPKTYYAVLVYDGDGYEAWYCDALDGAIGESVSDWYEENGLDLTFNAAPYKYIKA